MQAKAQVFAELVLTIETDIELGTNVFKLEDLYTAYDKTYKAISYRCGLKQDTSKGRDT